MIEKVPKDGYKNKIIYINGNNKTNEWKLWMTKKNYIHCFLGGYEFYIPVNH